MSMNQPDSVGKAENQVDLAEELRRKSMGFTSRLSGEDVIAILSEVIRYSRRRLYSTRTSASEKAVWGRILLSATDQFVRVATEHDADVESIAALLEKLPKRVLKRVECEIGQIHVRRVQK